MEKEATMVTSCESQLPLYSRGGGGEGQTKTVLGSCYIFHQTSGQKDHWTERERGYPAKASGLAESKSCV